jgi:hypothetical protein
MIHNIPACRNPELDETIHMRIPVPKYEMEMSKSDGFAEHIRRMMAASLADQLLDYCNISADEAKRGDMVFFEASIRIGNFIKERERTEKLMECIRLLQSELRSADGQIQSLKWLNNNGIKATS